MLYHSQSWGSCKVMPMLSLQHNELGGGLVAIENSTPEVIHVVSVSGPQRSHQVATIDSSNMQTITISAGSLNFPLNLVCIINWIWVNQSVSRNICAQHIRAVKPLFKHVQSYVGVNWTATWNFIFNRMLACYIFVPKSEIKSGKLRCACRRYSCI